MLLVATFINLSRTAHAQVIYTIAGSNFGDGGPATNATIGILSGVTTGASGTVYIADSYSSSVRKVDTDGIITTIVGTGQPGYSGDNGPATQAMLNVPTALAADASGNLYIADTGNNVIRRIDTKGRITTVAGDGGQGFSGDHEFAREAELNLPGGITLDGAGNLYISDTFNGRVRKVDSTGVIITIAGNGRQGYAGDGQKATAAEFNLPDGIAVDSVGNLFVADSGNNRVRKIAPNGTTSTVAGNGGQGYSGDGGLAVNAELDEPVAVAVDGDGNLYILDRGNMRIRKVDPTGVISTFAGNGNSGYSGDGGTATNATFDFLVDMAMDTSGDLYVADNGDHVVREINSNGVVSTLAGSCCSAGDGEAATLATLNYPVATVLDASGNLFIADFYEAKVRKVGPAGLISTVAGNGVPGYSGDGGPAGAAKLNGPSGLAVDSSGDLYIADSTNNVIRRVDTSGVITTVAGSGKRGYAGDGGRAIDAELNGPQGIAVDALGDLYIADTWNNVVRQVTTSGAISTIAGTGIPGSSGFGRATLAELNHPYSVTVSAQGTLYIADSGNGLIRSVSNGIIGTAAGNGGPESDNESPATGAGIGFPASVAVDLAGNLFIADTVGNRIHKVSSGIMTTLAGIGTAGFSGDGQGAMYAKLNSPFGVMTSPDGSLYVADSGNGRVREVAISQPNLLTNLDQFGLTGSWYNPETSGQGFEVQVFPDTVGSGEGILFAGWFTYDTSAAGGRRWYALQGNVSSNSPVATLSIFANTGGNLDAPPALSSGPILGFARIQFNDCDNASLAYQFTDGSGRAGRIPLTRLTPNVTCSSAGNINTSAPSYWLSGDWYDPATSGQGFMFDINPSINNLFAAWYTFKPNGEQIGGGASQDWYTLQSGQFTPGTKSIVDVPIVETTGGIFNNSAPATSTQVGLANISFSSCGSMILTYSFTGGADKGRSGKIDLIRVGSAPQSCGL
jgi:sugar lactone lactonase YvrE